MNTNYDFLIVGSGLFGATFARLATDGGYRCIVVERRNHPGGNVSCEDIDGINVHKYGPHIFHTSNQEVWDFVNSFVEFNRFTNSPLAFNKGCLYNLPFNMNTFRQIWGITRPEEARKILDRQRNAEWEKLRDSGVDFPRNLEEKALTMVGRDLFELLVRHYTEKQWGRKCADLPADIISRLPVRFTFDNNYFQDRFQGIPVDGYNPLISALLKNVEVKTGVDFMGNPDLWRSRARMVVYTGCIDEYFGYRFGRLQYRSVRFETESLPMANYQGNAVINYTDVDYPFTRIIEHKHFYRFGDEVYDHPHTVISREFSEEWKPGMEPFYPVNDKLNSDLLSKYNELASKEKNVIFGGRLAEYRYYDMDDVIERAINLYRNVSSTILQSV